MSFEKMTIMSEEYLKKNTYPGRGIIIGLTPDSRNYVQIYWIMGRSENSRNRIFEIEGERVRTKAFDEKKLIDPSLIIYYPIKNIDNMHIVSNGDQTDTIYDCLKKGEAFETAMMLREFEPDAPNYTPRISGIVDLEKKASKNIYKLSILKSIINTSDYCQRSIYNYETAIPGYGHCIHTYNGDGNPLPSFAGEPILVKLFDNIDDNAEYYWNMLNEENRISLLVKTINIESKQCNIKLINKNK